MYVGDRDARFRCVKAVCTIFSAVGRVIHGVVERCLSTTNSHSSATHVDVSYYIMTCFRLTLHQKHGIHAGIQ